MLTVCLRSCRKIKKEEDEEEEKGEGGGWGGGRVSVTFLQHLIAVGWGEAGSSAQTMCFSGHKYPRETIKNNFRVPTKPPRSDEMLEEKKNATSIYCVFSGAFV